MKKECLIMCATPLHLLIVEQIIKSNPNNDYDLILMFNEGDNLNKFHHYLNRIKPLCRNYLLYAHKPKILNLIPFRFKLVLHGFNKKYDELYLANILRAHFQLIVSLPFNSKATVITYDDGLANLLPSGEFYQDKHPDIFRHIIKKLLGIKYYSSDIKNLSIKHYTIYPNLPNIIGNTIHINLHPELSTKDDVTPVHSTIRIYLGQPLKGLNRKFSTQYIKNILDKFEIDYYFPHPREKHVDSYEDKVVQTDLIFEDYIIQFLNDNPRVKMQVYTFFSGAALNIANLNNVESIYIYDEFIHQNYKELYSIIEASNDISIMNIPD